MQASATGVTHMFSWDGVCTAEAEPASGSASGALADTANKAMHAAWAHLSTNIQILLAW